MLIDGVPLAALSHTFPMNVTPAMRVGVKICETQASVAPPSGVTRSAALVPIGSTIASAAPFVACCVTHEDWSILNGSTSWLRQICIQSPRLSTVVLSGQLRVDMLRPVWVVTEAFHVCGEPDALPRGERSPGGTGSMMLSFLAANRHAIQSCASARVIGGSCAETRMGLSPQS